MTPAENIILKFNGTRNAARILKLPVSTIQSWKSVGVIPARKMLLVMQAARSAGISLFPEDFFGHPAALRPDEAHCEGGRETCLSARMDKDGAG